MEHLLNRIQESLVSTRCLDEFSKGLSDAASFRDYERIDVGFTDDGLQIWCQRHDANICVIDFENIDAETMRPIADFSSLIKKTIS